MNIYTQTPAPTVTVKVLKGFALGDGADAVIGQVLDLPRGLAAQMINAQRAEAVAAKPKKAKAKK